MCLSPLGSSAVSAVPCAASTSAVPAASASAGQPPPPPPCRRLHHRRASTCRYYCFRRIPGCQCCLRVVSRVRLCRSPPPLLRRCCLFCLDFYAAADSRLLRVRYDVYDVSYVVHEDDVYEYVLLPYAVVCGSRCCVVVMYVYGMGRSEICMCSKVWWPVAWWSCEGRKGHVICVCRYCEG